MKGMFLCPECCKRIQEAKHCSFELFKGYRKKVEGIAFRFLWFLWLDIFIASA